MRTVTNVHEKHRVVDRGRGTEGKPTQHSSVLFVFFRAGWRVTLCRVRIRPSKKGNVAYRPLSLLVPAHVFIFLVVLEGCVALDARDLPPIHCVVRRTLRLRSALRRPVVLARRLRLDVELAFVHQAPYALAQLLALVVDRRIVAALQQRYVLASSGSVSQRTGLASTGQTMM